MSRVFGGVCVFGRSMAVTKKIVRNFRARPSFVARSREMSGSRATRVGKLPDTPLALPTRAVSGQTSSSGSFPSRRRVPLVIFSSFPFHTKTPATIAGLRANSHGCARPVPHVPFQQRPVKSENRSDAYDRNVFGGPTTSVVVEPGGERY